ncbi:MAG TPA: arginine deiminase-related protein [Candidatus Saccharimonadales bacterium]|nr:arginine deiminase-related protein [Candidatus Saccharimonadales bacterium]
MSLTFNRTVLMSGVDYFDDGQAINPFMNAQIAVNRTIAKEEHQRIKAALQKAGVRVVQVPAPEDSQDGVYTANWALVRGNKAVMARLPDARRAEEAYAAQVLKDLGKEIIYVPEGLRFSGQGDALPCGDLLFCGNGYRADLAAQEFAAETLGFHRIQLQTIPLRSFFGHQNARFGRPVRNRASGWPDSFYYDIDLALAVLKWPTENTRALIAYCPAAFTRRSREVLRALDEIDKIEVPEVEARTAFACNLVSTGTHVLMNAAAIQLAAAVKAHGLKPVLLENPELGKGGGSIRCTTLTLDNQ